MSTRLLKQLAVVILILNVFDALFTVIYTRTGLATESNPVMERILATSPVVFVIAKLALVTVCVAVLHRFRQRRLAAIALVGGAGLYALVCAYHLSAVPRLLALL
jgi:hypothetical protein